MSESHVENEIQARIARVRAEEERKRQQRAEFAAAREKGLAHRHATKLRHLATPVGGAANPSRGDTPTTASSPEETNMPTKTTVPVIQLVCPACRALRRAKPVGTATIGRRRREVVECGDTSCGLQWIAARDHLNATPTAA